MIFFSGGYCGNVHSHIIINIINISGWNAVSEYEESFVWERYDFMFIYFTQKLKDVVIYTKFLFYDYYIYNTRKNIIIQNYFEDLGEDILVIVLLQKSKLLLFKKIIEPILFLFILILVRAASFQGECCVRVNHSYFWGPARKFSQDLCLWNAFVNILVCYSEQKQDVAD